MLIINSNIVTKTIIFGNDEVPLLPSARTAKTNAKGYKALIDAETGWLNVREIALSGLTAEHLIPANGSHLIQTRLKSYISSSDKAKGPR